MASIFEELKSDHDEIKDLLGKLANTTARAEKKRTELLEKLKLKLTVHAKVEEAVFYSPLREARKTRDVVLEGFNEHRVADGLLQELAIMPCDNDQWTAKLKLLKELVEHHIEEEENEMFSGARQTLKEDKATELGNQFRSRSRVIAAALEPVAR